MENEEKKALLSHQKFAAAVRASGYTQAEIAEDIGISDRYVRTLETEDKNISISMAFNIGQVLKCPIESLLTKNPARSERYSLNQTIMELVEIRQVQFADKKVKIKTRLAKDMPLIEFNKKSIKQVIDNCLANSLQSISLKAQANGRIFICTRFDEYTETAQILITDNGIGLTPEQQAKLLKPCYTKGLRNNTSISQAIIEQHGGYMSINCTPGKGCCVHIELPLNSKQ